MKTAQNQTALLRQQESELRDAVGYAVEIARKAGASAEVAVTKVSGLSVSTRLQEVENVEFNNDGALGISVYIGRSRTGYRKTHFTGRLYRLGGSRINGV